MAFPTFTPRRPTAPLNIDTFNTANNLDIRIDRSKMMADLLTNKIAHNERLPDSPLEGGSRVIAALAGGHQRSQHDSMEKEKRETLANILGGENMTAAERYAFSSGDPSLIKAVIASRMSADSRRDPIEEKYRNLVAAGVPPDRARAIAAGAMTTAQDGTVVDYTTGTRWPGNGMDPQTMAGFANGPRSPAAPPAVTETPLPPAAGPGAPPPAATAPPASPPAAVVPPPGQTAPAGNNLIPGQATRTAAEKDITSGEPLQAVLADLERLYDPRFFQAPSQVAATAENFVNRMGGDVDFTNRNRRNVFNSAVGRAFDVYRKDITGAAAAQQELERLQQNFLSADMTHPQFKANLRALQMIGERNRNINVELLARGIQRGAPNYGAEFDAIAASRPLNMEEVVRRLDEEDRAAGVTRRGPLTRPAPGGARSQERVLPSNPEAPRVRTWNPETGRLE